MEPKVAVAVLSAHGSNTFHRSVSAAVLLTLTSGLAVRFDSYSRSRIYCLSSLPELTVPNEFTYVRESVGSYSLDNCTVLPTSPAQAFVIPLLYLIQIHFFCSLLGVYRECHCQHGSASVCGETDEKKNGRFPVTFDESCPSIS